MAAHRAPPDPLDVGDAEVLPQVLLMSSSIRLMYLVAPSPGCVICLAQMA
jgi:hypothetical protein